MAERGTAARAGGAPAPSRLGMFLGSSLFDLVIVWAVSVALTFTVSYGFDSASEWRGNVALIAAVQLPILLALFAGSWSKRAVLPAAAVAVALCAAVVGASVALSTEPIMVDRTTFMKVSVTGLWVNDAPGAYLIFGFLLALVPVAVYLLSRRTAGLVALSFLAALSCGWVQFLYRDWASGQPGIPALLVCAAGIVALFPYQTYRSSLRQAQHAKAPSFGGVFASSALTGAACVAAGSLLFLALVNPLGLPTVEMKPFTHYYDYPVELYTGTYQERPTDSPDETSDNARDEGKTTDDAEGGEESQQDQGGEATGEDSAVGVNALLSAFDASNWDPQYREIAYFVMRWGPFIAAALIAAAVAAAALVWRRQREARLARLERRQRTYGYRIWFLYGFLMGRFRRLKLYRPFNLTPMEFALGAKRAMAPFAEGTGGVDFVDVTDLYQRVCYGGYQATAEDYALVESYYRAFFKNARLHTGRLKWLWTFWRM